MSLCNDLPYDCDHKAGNPCQCAGLIVCGCDHISLTELTLDTYWGLTEMLDHSVSWLSYYNSCSLLLLTIGYNIQTQLVNNHIHLYHNF